MTYSFLGRHTGPLRRFLMTSLLAGAALLPLSAAAGYVTTNEAGMDSIFSQGSFANSPIDIRFNATQTLYNTALLNIDSASDFSTLGGMNPWNSNTVMAFFVDTISWCGGPGSNIIGCGELPGNVFTINSSWAANATYGAALLSHELGHNLGLSHSSTNGNLMYSILTGGTTLTSGQASTILSSSLVQWDSQLQQRYISITPIAVVATLAVPEPETYALLSAGLMLLGVIGRRRRALR